LQDADASVVRDEDFVKGYLRKAEALLQLDRLEECVETLKKGKEKGEMEEIEQLLQAVEAEIKQINILAKDSPENQINQKLIDWLQQGKSEFPKLKLRWYDKNYRGVHASKKI